MASTETTQTTQESNPSIPVHFPTEEEKILKLWDELDAFQTSLKLSEGRPVFSFFDGPPFATGLPHYGHLLAGTVKDVVTRYAHMTGHYVERRFGWDCHGLPVEYEIDKTFNIQSRDDVLNMGIATYNQHCRSIVMRYAKEWESTVKRTGRWIDFDNDYKTMHTPFMESVWWVFQQLFNKGLVYRGYRVMPYSTACHTPLANFEASQNYKEVQDPSIIVTFPLHHDPTTAFLAWTTTPWTLPSNLALCVHPDFEYIKFLDEETQMHYIVLEKRLDMVYKDVKKAKFSIKDRMKGRDLKGMEYTPLFDYFYDKYHPKGAFRVVCDSYVTDDTGTGIVHQAPAFGEDDHRVCLDANIIQEDDLPCPMDEAGQFTEPVVDYKGLYFKDADKLILKALKQQQRLFKQSTLTHMYPFCWRSDTPLMYRAVPSWFVRVATIRDALCQNNLKSRWVPHVVQEKRFHHWLLNARDWNISRNRFWGTPIPIWTNSDFSEMVCIGSVAELQSFTNQSNITDLHRDTIDSLTIPSPSGQGVLHRIDEVFDCWFESGSMPYAQQHYPFENKDRFQQGFPADFISEGIDQTRGWFYTLMVLSTHLFDSPPFKNLIVTGLILASDGKKMSKRLKNYPDPMHMLNTYGADALRLYLIQSPAVRGEALAFKEEGVRDIVSKILLPWYNSYKFFLNQTALLHQLFQVNFTFPVSYGSNLNGTHTNQNETEPQKKTFMNPSLVRTNVMDRWVVASLHSLIQFVTTEMSDYKLYTVVPALIQWIDQLTNMYIRYNRKRLKGEGGLEDTLQALSTLFEVLFTLAKIMASFTPFLSELMYQKLRTYLSGSNLNALETKSIHFQMFPKVLAEYADPVTERRVHRMQQVIELARLIRDRCTIGLKTPIKELVIVHTDALFLEDVSTLESYMYEELNVKQITFTSNEEQYHVAYKVDADFRALGAKLRHLMPKVKQGLTQLTSKDIEQLTKKGELEVAGVILTRSELTISKYYNGPSSTWEAAHEKDVLILMDVSISEAMEQEAWAREVVNRVQRLRKKVGLVPTDLIEYYYTITYDPQSQLQKVVQEMDSFLLKTLKRPISILPEPKLLQDKRFLVQEEQEINGCKFNLTFYWED